MKSKVGAALFALVFALGFGAGGYFGISQLATQLHGWWQARDWQPVPATVLATELKESHGDDATTYQATARYRYTFQGRGFEGTRVGFTGGFDNVGTWQRDHYQQLVAAQRDNTPVTVWIDPSDPRRSVFDREIRGSLLAFSIPFATLFPLVSLAAFWMLVKVLCTPASEAARTSSLADNPTSIKSAAWPEAGILWFVAAFWNLIAFPFAILAAPDVTARPWLLFFVLIFPGIGILILWTAIARTIRILRNGNIRLALSPPQPRLGESFAVHISCDRPPESGEFKLSLLCEQVDNRGDSSSNKTVWRQERTVQSSGADVLGSLTAPAQLPASEPKGDLYHRWRVLVSFPSSKDERTFDVVLAPAHEGMVASDHDPNFVGLTNRDVPARPVPETVATIDETDARLAIRYHPAKERGTAIATAAFSLLFGGVGALVLIRAEDFVPKILGVIAAATCVALAVACIYALTHRRQVEIGLGRLRVANRWLLSARDQSFDLGDVRALIPDITGTTSTGSRSVDHHRIKARLRDGSDVVLASNIRDAGVARTLLELLKKHLSHAALTKDGTSGELSARFARMKQQRAQPPIDAKRRLGWFKLGIQAVAAIPVLAIVWSLFSGGFFGDTPTTNFGNVERPRQVPGMSTADRALFEAVERGAASVKQALASGANVHTVNDWGATPLVVAARIGNSQIVKDLIAAGADVNFAVAANNEYRGRTALMNAAFAGRELVVDILLDAGADAGAFESHGWSALHYAARCGDVETLKTFARHHIGLDLRSPQERSGTPLMIAARFGMLDSIRTLIELGADPRAKDSHGENVYGWAKYFNQTGAMEVLSNYQ